MEWVVRGMMVSENTPENETVAATGTVQANTTSESGSTASGPDVGVGATTASDAAAKSREALRDYLAAPKLLQPCPFVTNDTTDLPQFTVAGCRAIETIAETSTGACFFK